MKDQNSMWWHIDGRLVLKLGFIQFIHCNIEFEQRMAIIHICGLEFNFRLRKYLLLNHSAKIFTKCRCGWLLSFSFSVYLYRQVQSLCENISHNSVNHQHLNHWCWHLYFYFHSRCLTHNLIFHLPITSDLISHHLVNISLDPLGVWSLGPCADLCFMPAWVKLYLWNFPNAVSFSNISSDLIHGLLGEC